MPCWADGPMVAFDLETTGIDSETARIVTASVVSINGSVTKVQSWLANPGIEIPAEATAVHRITTGHARAHGKPEMDVAIEVAAALHRAWEQQVPVVIYNAPYDLTLVDRALRRYLTEGLGDVGFVVDPLVLDKALDRYRKGSRKLTVVAEHYNVPLSEDDAHGSTADAIAAARVAWKLAHIYLESVGSMEPDELMRFQASRYASQAASFEDYLRRQGKQDVIRRNWPIVPIELAGVHA